MLNHELHTKHIPYKFASNVITGQDNTGYVCLSAQDSNSDDVPSCKIKL